MQPEEYYNDSENYGSYQYVPLKEVIDSLLFRTTVDDSIIKNVKRTEIIKYAKEALREINKEIPDVPKVIEITVPENLSVVLPHDYVSYHRISLVVKDEQTNSYRLKPLNRNQNINIAQAQLQANNYELLFDNQGRVLTTNGKNAYSKPYKRYEFVQGGDSKQISRFGEYVISKRDIVFSSDLFDKDIVLEYRTDGLQLNTYGEDAIKIHKDTITVTKDLIYFMLIEFRKNVPDREKNRAWLKYSTSRHQARLNKLDFDLVEVSRNARESKI